MKGLFEVTDENCRVKVGERVARIEPGFYTQAEIDAFMLYETARFLQTSRRIAIMADLASR